MELEINYKLIFYNHKQRYISKKYIFEEKLGSFDDFNVLRYKDINVSQFL